MIEVQRRNEPEGPTWRRLGTRGRLEAEPVAEPDAAPDGGSLAAPEAQANDETSPAPEPIPYDAEHGKAPGAPAE